MNPRSCLAHPILLYSVQCSRSFPWYVNLKVLC
jgi:hypothetical protein